MKLIQIATGAAVISTPLWAMAFMQGDRPGDAWFDTNAIQAEGLAADGYFSWHDYTNDGLADALHTDYNFDFTQVTVTLFIGLGNGVFSDQSPISIEDPDSMFFFGSKDSVDVNGDGYLDLVVHRPPNSVAIFLNTGGTGFRCAGDVDGDGQTRVEDLVGLLEDWGCDDNAQ